MSYTLIRDPELEGFLPLCPTESTEKLEEMLVEHGGPSDPIKVWEETGKIIDGYRRHAICVKHNLPFEVEEMSFTDIMSVKRWMFNQQDSRRNWRSPHERSLVLTQLIQLVKDESSKNEGEKPISKSKAIAAAAKQAGVTERTAYRATSYMDAFNSLADSVKKIIEVNAVKASQQDVIDLAILPHPQQEAVISDVQTGEFSSLTAALRGEGSESSKEDDIDDPDFLDEESVQPNRASHRNSSSKSKSKASNKNTFKDAETHMGILKKDVDVLGDLHPGPEYQKLIKLLDRAGEMLLAWKGSL